MADQGGKIVCICRYEKWKGTKRWQNVWNGLLRKGQICLDASKRSEMNSATVSIVSQYYRAVSIRALRRRSPFFLPIELIALPKSRPQLIRYKQCVNTVKFTQCSRCLSDSAVSPLILAYTGFNLKLLREREKSSRGNGVDNPSV